MINYSKKEKNQSTSKHENDTCSVCQYEYNEGERLRQLRCGHAFHKDCVDEWLKKEKKCPVCNHEY